MNPITERHVQAIWYDASLRPRRLYTRRGSEVTVVTPGVWNLGAGPDFKNAVLEIGKDRRRIVGDVEVHLCPSDWDFHHHGADPRYRNVIAHVTWGCGPVPDSLPPGAISIWIGRFLTGDPAFSPASIDLLAYPYARLPDGERPCERRIAHDPEVARRILTAAGRHRLKMKSRRLLGRLSEPASSCCRELVTPPNSSPGRTPASATSSRREPVVPASTPSFRREPFTSLSTPTCCSTLSVVSSETGLPTPRAADGGGEASLAQARRRQVFYEEVMSALGYSRNTAPFRRVAERIPIAELPLDVEAAKTAFLTAGTFEEWDRLSTRPNNTPEIRLSHAAEIFTSTPMMSLADASDFAVSTCISMVDSVTFVRRAACDDVASPPVPRRAACGEVPSPAPRSEGGAAAQRCLGRGRAGAIIANVIVPWAIAEGRLAEAPEWLPPEDISDPVRLTAFRLFGRDHNPAAFYSTNGLLIQGLLQIHRDYCLQVHPDCSDCNLLSSF